MDQQTFMAQQFGSTAHRYLTSTVHAIGADLDRLEAYVQKSQAANVLDLGCGAGHASFALARGGARRVVAYDLATPMLDVVAAQARARGHNNLQTRAGAVEQLPFADGEFDLVTTRFSAHHWLDAQMGLFEAARVLKPGGTVIVIDVLSPESPLLDTVLQTVEVLRDRSHVRNYRASEWRAMLATANFAPAKILAWKLPMEFTAWVARIGTSAARVAALHVVLDELPQEARDFFALRPDRSFAIDAGWFESHRGPNLTAG